jgi:hypothetical protein
LFTFITNFLEPVAYLLYFIAILIYRKRASTNHSQVLFIYYLSITVVHLAGSIATKVADNNVWSYDLGALLTSVFTGLYFYQLFPSKTKKTTIAVLVGIYLLYAIYRNITLEGQRLFDSIGYTIVCASVAVYVFMYFHGILKNVTEANILKEFNFWLASVYLIYYVGSFLIFASFYYFTLKVLDGYTQADSDIMTALWGMHNVLLFLSALMLLISCLWITSRRKLASSI